MTRTTSLEVGEALPQLYLCAGDLLTTGRPCEVTTILGPCVAVTLWNRAAGVAAICHAMLPDPLSSQASTGREAAKYVSTAVHELLARFRRLGGMDGRVQVKLFGGANVIETAAGVPSHFGVGERNVERAREVLASAGLLVAASDVGGRRGRKLIFNTETGDVRVRPVGGLQLLAA